VQSTSNGSGVIYLGQRIDVFSSPQLRKQLQELYEQSCYNITIDFSATRSIDSSCLGELLIYQKKLKERQGGIKIVNVSSEYIKKMFDMIQLQRVIRIE